MSSLPCSMSHAQQPREFSTGWFWQYLYRSHPQSVERLSVSAGIPFDACPRSALVKLVEDLAQSQRLQFQVGFETEFYLLRPCTTDSDSTSLVPLDTTLYCQTSAINGAAQGTVTAHLHLQLIHYMKARRRTPHIAHARITSISKGLANRIVNAMLAVI